MKMCSTCNEEAVLISGYNYCSSHLGEYEVRFFERAVGGRFRTEADMHNFFIKAFGTIHPRMSDLQRWHGRIPRGEWHRHKDGPWHWDMGQDEYINMIANRVVPEVKHEKYKRTEGSSRNGGGRFGGRDSNRIGITAPAQPRRRKRGARGGDGEMDV